MCNNTTLITNVIGFETKYRDVIGIQSCKLFIEELMTLVSSALPE